MSCFVGREQRSLSQLDCLENSVLIVKSACGLATVTSGAQLTEVLIYYNMKDLNDS